MNKEIKTQWVAALRSGEYRQGRSALHNSEEQFCCLGVLCDLAVRAGEDIEVDTFGYVISYDESTDFLPESVQEWSGMDTEDGEFRTGVDEPMETLVDANDSGTGFSDIADLIEKYF